MDVLNILSNNTLFLSILIGILLINFGCIVYLIIREKRLDKKEIYDILNEQEIDKSPKEKSIEELSFKDSKEEPVTKKEEPINNEIEEMLLKMQKDLEATPKDVVESFENEQEEKSIISYQELLNSVKEKQKPKVTPVKIDEKIEINDFDNDKTLKMDRIDPNKKFKSTEFISPIFGVQDSDIKYPSVPKLLNKEEDIFDKLNIEKEEKIINTKRLDAEIKKNDDFLKALKEFRKNLD